MSKFKIKYKIILFLNCDFLFYESGWKCKSMYGGNVYQYKFCLPFLIGFVKYKSWVS